MNCYEHTFIAKQHLPESQNKKLVEKYQNIINKNSGKVLKTEEWGLKTLSHQIKNFVRFCEAVIQYPGIKTIKLITKFDEDTDIEMLNDKIEELKQSLLDIDIVLTVEINENLHDREIRIDNGWAIKIGRGLDFFQKPDTWSSIGSNDLSLRRCLETNVDIYKSE